MEVLNYLVTTGESEAVLGETNIKLLWFLKEDSLLLCLKPLCVQRWEGRLLGWLENGVTDGRAVLSLFSSQCSQQSTQY